MCDCSTNQCVDCLDDGDCPDWEECSQGKCVEKPCPYTCCVSAQCPPSCPGHSACSGGKICGNEYACGGAEHKCIECGGDFDCSGSSECDCSSNKCKAPVSSQCNDWECPRGQICDKNGRCKPSCEVDPRGCPKQRLTSNPKPVKGKESVGGAKPGKPGPSPKE